jgi:predicted RNA-binding Zn-ribbon protein involved in translation (DUF1610 family)
MTCNSCHAQIDLIAALEHSPRSWPGLRIVLHVCPQCGTRLYLRFETDAAHLVRASSALGPRWDWVDTEKRPGITFRAEPEGLHVRIDHANYFVPARWLQIPSPIASA